MDNNDVLTVAQAAQLLSVDRKVIYAMITDGLPHQRIGRRIIRIRRGELLAFGRKTAAA